MSQREAIVQDLLDYVHSASPVAKNFDPLPLDRSLLEMGVLDSFGIIELVSFIEKRWGIKIYDSEITVERFGGVTKMANVIAEKLAAKAKQPAK